MCRRSPKAFPSIVRGILRVNELDFLVEEKVLHPLWRLASAPIDHIQTDRQIPVEEPVALEIVVVFPERVQQGHGNGEPGVVDDKFDDGHEGNHEVDIVVACQMLPRN